MRLNVTTNNFVFVRTNRGIAPRTFFTKLARQRTSRNASEFTVNSFAFGRENRGIRPRTFSVKLAGRELPKCV